MKVSIGLGLAVAGLVLAGVAAGAQAPAGEPGFVGHKPPFERALGSQGARGRWWNSPEMIEKLKLTDDQRKAMDAILLQHREKLVDLKGNVEKAEIEMEPLMRDDQPNEAKIVAQIDKVAQARAELEKANARFLLALRGKLTPEQWKLVQAERANHGQERRGWEQRGQRPGNQHRQRGEGTPQMPPPPPGPQGMMDQGQDSEESAAPEAGGTM
jgi:Spy/CpxP family protein refolding chaperone